MSEEERTKKVIHEVVSVLAVDLVMNGATEIPIMKKLMEFCVLFYRDNYSNTQSNNSDNVDIG